jgi:hypothetical protein
LSILALALTVNLSVAHAQRGRGARRRPATPARNRPPQPPATPAAAPAAPQVEIAPPKSIVLDPLTGTGGGLLMLRNKARSPVKVMLSAGDVKSTTTGQPLRAAVTFSKPGDAAGKDIYEETVAPGATSPVQVNVADLNEAGEVQIALNNFDQAVAALKVLNFKFTFAVKLGSDNPEVRFERGRPTQITLFNDDDVGYPVDWRIYVKGRLLYDSLRDNKPPLPLPPKGAANIDLPAAADLFSDAGSKVSAIFREETQDGVLELRPRLKTDFVGGYMPAKSIAFKARLGYWSSFVQQLLGTLIVLCVLFLGGVVSLLLSHYLPNILRRRDVKDRLSVVAAKCSNISDRIDSSLRVLVRVEQRRLKELLKLHPIISPDMGRIFTQCEQGILTLGRRVGLLEKVDSIYERINNLSAVCPPPSLKNKVEEQLSKATALLKDPEPQETCLQAIQALINEAEVGVERLGTGGATFEAELRERLELLHGEFFSPGGILDQSEKSRALRGLIPGPFNLAERLKAALPPNSGLGVSPASHSRIDISLTILGLLRDYALLYDGTTVSAVRDRLDEHEGELLALVSLQSWSSLRKAGLLLRQMREGIFVSDVLGAIQAGQVDVEIDPPVVRPYVPVHFRAQFLRPDMDDSAARDQFQCEWVFDDGYEERGWHISHYFTETRSYKVSVRFTKPDGSYVEAEGGRGVKFVIDKEARVHRDKSPGKWDRFMAEGVRLLIALFIALLGLITGAQEQLSKMDFIPGLITVFLLGFSADAIKNLLTQRTQPAG